jgi:hypothetical protein
LEWSKEKGGLTPKYNAAANEIHHLQLLEKMDSSEMERLSSEWSRLEQRLRPIYGSASVGDDDLLRLICKGRSLFGIDDVNAKCYSFSQAVERACAHGGVPEKLSADLRAFVETFIPSTRAGALKLRSFVHVLADVPRSGQCKLRDATLEYLHRQRTELVETMPGFREKKKGITVVAFGSNRRFEYAPELRKLLDHTVFQRFSFIALN